MGTPGQFIEQAMLSGYEQGAQRRQNQKQQLSDEEHAQALADHNNTIATLQQKMSQVGPNDPNYGALQNQLNQTVEDRTALFHPDTPGGLHRLGELVWKRVHGQQPQPPMETTPTAATASAPLPNVAPVTMPDLPGAPGTTLPSMGGTAVPQMPAVPGVAIAHPAPTAGEMKARAAQELAWGAPAAPANPYLQLRDQLKAALPNLSEEDLQRALEVHAKVIGAPAAEKAETWKPLGKPYEGEGGVIFQTQQDAQGNLRRQALPEGTELPAPVAHLSTFATQRADYARAKGKSPEELTFQDDLDMTNAIKQSGAGMTVSDQIRFVPQPDGTVKAVPVRQTSQKLFSGAQPSSIPRGTPPTVEETAGIPRPVAPARPGGIISGTNSLGHPITEDSTGKVTDTVTGQVTQLPGRYVGTSSTTPQRSSTMAVANPKGLVEPGNLPIWNRPTVRNADGTHSSEYSTSFQDDQGREVLVPTVVNGRFLTPDGKKPPEGSPQEKAMFQRAWQHYIATGENLGKFDNAANANSYSQILHNRGNQPASARSAATPADLKARAARVQSAAGMAPSTAESKGTGFVQGGDIVGGRATPAQTTANKLRDAAQLSYLDVQKASQDPTPLGDQGIILAWLRGRVNRVTQSEIQSVNNLGGAEMKLEGNIARITTGKMSDAQRQWFLRSAKDNYDNTQQVAAKYGVAPGSTEVGSDMVMATIPGVGTQPIHRSQIEAFKKKYPNGTVNDGR